VTAAQRAAGTWRIDPAHATASFQVPSLGRTATGTVPVVNGTVEIGADGQLLAVHGVLHLAAIDTGIAKRDLDLRKRRLLDLDAHPMMTFTSTAVEPADTGWRVTGTLTARGVTTRLTGTASTVDGTMTATARLDRRTLGIRVPGFVIGRFVNITVTAALQPR
jgi:polyisoprenoid-binding protein YceI